MVSRCDGRVGFRRERDGASSARAAFCPCHPYEAMAAMAQGGEAGVARRAQEAALVRSAWRAAAIAGGRMARRREST
jgi:hypothetical protein